MRCKQAMETWLVTRRSLPGTFGSRGWQPVGQVGRAPHCLLLSARLFHPEKGGRRLHRQITCSKCKKIIPQKEKKSAHQPFTACCSSPLRHRSPQLKSLLDVFSEIASRPNGLVHFVWKILRIPQAIPPETPLRAALLGCSYSLHITLNETSLQINVWFYLYYQATREGF